MLKLKELKLNGKVKSVRETSELLNGRTCQPVSGSITYFNEAGKLIKSENYQSSLAGVYNSENSYDKNERLIKTVTTINKIVTAIDVYHYHPNGSISQIESRSSTVGLRAPTGPVKLNKCQITKYDPKDNEIELMNYMDRKKVSKSIFTHDKNGLISEEIEFDENDQIEEENTSQKVISLQSIPTGKMIAPQEEIQYEYDDNRNWTKKIPLIKNYPIRVKRREITYYD